MSAAAVPASQGALAEHAEQSQVSRRAIRKRVRALERRVDKLGRLDTQIRVLVYLVAVALPVGMALVPWMVERSVEATLIKHGMIGVQR